MAQRRFLTWLIVATISYISFATTPLANAADAPTNLSGDITITSLNETNIVLALDRDLGSFDVIYPDQDMDVGTPAIIEQGEVSPDGTQISFPVIPVVNGSTKLGIKLSNYSDPVEVNITVNIPNLASHYSNVPNFECSSIYVGGKSKCILSFQTLFDGNQISDSVAWSLPIVDSVIKYRIVGQKKWTSWEEYFYSPTNQPDDHWSLTTPKLLKSAQYSIMYGFPGQTKLTAVGKIPVMTPIKVTAPGAVIVGNSFTAIIRTDLAFVGTCIVSGITVKISKGLGRVVLRSIRPGSVSVVAACSDKDRGVSYGSWDMYIRS